ncbi:MAG: cyclopropane-fatty-acyl-phospholipid synthase [Euryarchaeota archaeon]|nr:cyclopropane-fatty-acyl-phospholipid synthase [Euryarchaeota archaeon]
MAVGHEKKMSGIYEKNRSVGYEQNISEKYEKKILKQKNVWEEFFADKKRGGHRSSAEEFLAMEAREKLFHLDGGKTLFDFGCGAGELLVYYAPEYEKTTGVDFSPSMLEEASKRIKERNCENTTLILADDKTVWDKLDSSFDRITAAGVFQYLTYQEIDDFLFNASKYLNEGGKIVLFDMLDPRLYPLWKIGLFSQDKSCRKMLSKVICGVKNSTSSSLKKRPRDILGYSHHPNKIKKIANKNGFEMICVQSMYYEYKYHAIIFRS